jgi:hypothetical protein
MKSQRQREIDRNEEAYEILRDLVSMDSEKWAIGGGSGWKEREAAIWKRARELFEP